MNVGGKNYMGKNSILAVYLVADILSTSLYADANKNILNECRLFMLISAGKVGLR